MRLSTAAPSFGSEYFAAQFNSGYLHHVDLSSDWALHLDFQTWDLAFRCLGLCPAVRVSSRPTDGLWIFPLLIEQKARDECSRTST